MLQMHRKFASTALLAACLIGAGVSAAEPLKIFVSANGSDTAAGTTDAAPVKTLAKALKLYETSCASRPTQVVLASGSYGEERVVLKRAPCPLTIEAASADRPKFDGQGEGTWLRLDMPGVKQIDVTITGMDISNYQSGISIDGNRSDPEGWIGGVKILKNRFFHIGSFREDQPPATAAVRLVNARGVLIEGNDFDTIRNVKQCGGLHSVYIAHTSSDNRVVGNSFINGCGETIKVRDSSNRNVVERNRFERQEGSALMLDSYCGASAGTDCTKPEGECPSYGNSFKDNTVVGPRALSNKNNVYARKVAPKLPPICGLARSTGDRDRISEDRTSSR